MQREIHIGSMSARAWGNPDGSPVLLVHGVSGTSWDWIRTVTRIKEAARYIVAVDLPGFGRSEWLEPDSYRPAALADMIGAFAREVFNGRDYAYVGHSFGGKMGILLAGRNESIAELVLVDNGTDLGPGSKTVRRRLREWPVEFPHFAAAADQYRDLYPAEADDVFLLRMNEYLYPRKDGSVALRRDPRFVDVMTASDPQQESQMLREAWRSVTVPTRILRAAKSKMLTPETVEWMLATNPQASATELANVGHNVLSESPQLLAHELRSLWIGNQTAE